MIFNRHNKKNPMPADSLRVNGQAGFTIIEALVAIFILMLAITAPLLSASLGIRNTDLSRDRTAAAFLAQDAAEYIITLKDQNALQGKSWLAGLGACEGNGGCQIDSVEEKVNGCSAEGCQPISINQNTGQYGYVSGADWQTSKFTRTVTFDTQSSQPTLGGEEALVTVGVTWPMQNGKTGSVMIKLNIFNIPA